jgi:hypothetical protein
MMKTKPAKMYSLRDVRLEKERLRYMALKTELEFTKQLRQTRKLFTIPNLFNQSQYFLASYVRRIVSGWFR